VEIVDNIECTLGTYLLFGPAADFSRFASALLMNPPIFWMYLPVFWPRASRVGYGHRWPFSLRIVNKAVSRTQSLARSMPKRNALARITAPWIEASWQRST